MISICRMAPPRRATMRRTVRIGDEQRKDANTARQRRTRSASSKSSAIAISGSPRNTTTIASARRERQEAGTRAQGELVKSLIDSLDDLERVTAQDPETVDARTIHQGIEVVNKKLMKALAAAGLELIDPVDQTFDPELHEAVSTEPALSPEDDHLVSRVFQQGYRFNGQLLRPARVVVKQWNG